MKLLFDVTNLDQAKHVELKSVECECSCNLLLKQKSTECDYLKKKFDALSLEYDDLKR